MKIKILASGSQGLIDGYWFYEKQAEGPGIYFLDSLALPKFCPIPLPL